MNQKQIAREIYFHAVAYYFAEFLEHFHIYLSYIKKHAEIIDLEDKGDTKFREFCYYIFWALPSIKKRKGVRRYEE